MAKQLKNKAAEGVVEEVVDTDLIKLLFFFFRVFSLNISLLLNFIKIYFSKICFLILKYICIYGLIYSISFFTSMYNLHKIYA